MARAKWKGAFLDNFFLKKLSKKKVLDKIWSRRSVIPFFLIGNTVRVHNGKIYKKLIITREKVGFKFGAFIKTRTKPTSKKFKK
jgi:small subunit ribosomal protein S19